MAILRAHGLDLASPEYGGVNCSITQLLTPTSELKFSETHSFKTAFGIHRSDMHDALFKAATRADGNGRPAEVLVGRRVASVVCLSCMWIALVSLTSLRLRMWREDPLLLKTGRLMSPM
jgi:hypothetical protein